MQALMGLFGAGDTKQTKIEWQNIKRDDECKGDSKFITNLCKIASKNIINNNLHIFYQEHQSNLLSCLRKNDNTEIYYNLFFYLYLTSLW